MCQLPAWHRQARDRVLAPPSCGRDCCSVSLPAAVRLWSLIPPPTSCPTPSHTASPADRKLGYTKMPASMCSTCVCAHNMSGRSKDCAEIHAVLAHLMPTDAGCDTELYHVCCIGLVWLLAKERQVVTPSPTGLTCRLSSPCCMLHSAQQRKTSLVRC